jgi:hypothetical protein
VILMILYVFLDHVFGHFVSNSAGKVAIFPKFSSPQFPFDLRISLEDGSCRCPLQPLDNSRYRIFRWKSQEDMYVILSNLHLFYLKIIAYCDLCDALLNKNPSDLLSLSICGILEPTLCGILCRIRHGLRVVWPCLHIKPFYYQFKG